ncbi:membrane protein, putative [Lactobacillus delbrueckii subsp. bulgaricus]|nr:membrane protein, putative [Lactobacillus delbrueckii subsp. bulgaricus]
MALCLLPIDRGLNWGLAFSQVPGKNLSKISALLRPFSAGLLLYSGRQKQPKQATKLGRIGAYFGLFVAGIYAGYFGAASGVLTLIFLTALSDSSFIVINAIKSVIGSLANLVALALFAFKGGGNWPVAFPLAIGLFIGGYFGQKMIKYLKPAWVRWITACFSVLLAIYLGWRAWG